MAGPSSGSNCRSALADETSPCDDSPIAGGAPMEPTDLTCGQCGTSWKLIKAGNGPITCPHCKATIEQGTPAAPPTPPAEVRAPEAVAPPLAAAGVRPAAPTEISDADDPGIGAPPRARFPVPDVPRRGRHPLVTVAVVLLLMLLVPLALIACLFAVCAV